MNTKTTLAVCCLLMAAGAPGAARAGNADASVGKKLDALGLKYEVDADGDYKLLFDVENGRSQIVWVRSPVETLGNMRIREVLSIAGKSPKPRNDEEVASAAVVATAALLDASKKKLGGWVLKGTDDTQAFYYVAQIPADASGDDLKSVVVSVAKSTDGFEQLLETINGSEKDKY
ncbi:hypothetical protein H9L17_04135 [Thermomonas brevis]|uniref:PepSY domain-containing protein n=1 Tax=Thermomonas brevis TaxID=215691 RepID=A0A7G9QVH6_9GAMM|nr:hypothetical protein [Thermomonas brevis]QNN47351.1 hypothetical protein H9L17_04135 [Thermomonas brevis]